MNAYNLMNHQAFTQLPSRNQVLYLYRRIFRMANQWEKVDQRDAIR
ncbi:hypothetical protein PPL_02793 [Heterostelium album PN500]|uniref:Uncharacterized protein n=1 Tax=Heterostelium pallidum (strain ATCC 26659 / Pp 5 / PN500) TaxID=670386 RepID=D3B328_HETP5|nr:hypothetical protein PPL_02793 [Heterostelium album PN500]EFA83726.1 hypothetical protein PPL_02793 [Heterostelium album PN500]|eukprot:XP_020435843.1 hypothetical protein PPL_02793 [Heterostelium album PN500]